MLPILLPTRILSDEETNYRNNLNDEEDEEFELLVQTYLKDMNYTSVNQASFNLAYSMINVGLVGIPYVAYEAGIPLFVICIILCIMISIYTTTMVLEMANDVNVRTLEDLAEKAFGPRGFFVTCIAQIIFSLLLMCITLDVWGEIMPKVLKEIIGTSIPDHTFFFHLLTHRRPVIILGAIIVIPLCFARTMSTLSWPSYLTVCALVMSVLFVLIALFGGDTCSGRFCHLDDVDKPKYYWWTVQSLLAFCFTYQHKLFFVYNCLRRRTVPRFRRAVISSNCYVGLMYLLFGTLGALNAVQHNDDEEEDTSIKLNYFSRYGAIEGPELIFNITRGVVATSLLFTIPVDCLVAVTTWRRLRRRYIRYLKTKTWEQDIYEIQPGQTGSFSGHRKGSDENVIYDDERGGLLSEEKYNNNNNNNSNNSNQSLSRSKNSQVLMDEDDVICVEMMRLGGCLAPKSPDNSFSVRNNSSLDRGPIKTSTSTSGLNDMNQRNPSGIEPNFRKNNSIATSSTSYLSSLEPSRFSFPNGQNIEYDPNEIQQLQQLHHHQQQQQQQQQQQLHQLHQRSNIENDFIERSTKSDLKVSFVDPRNSNSNSTNNDLSRISEATSDFSTARTVAWNRQTFESKSQLHRHGDGNDDNDDDQHSYSNNSHNNNNHHRYDSESYIDDDRSHSLMSPTYSQENINYDDGNYHNESYNTTRRSSIGQLIENRRSVPEYLNHGFLVTIILTFILLITTLINSYIIWVSIIGSIITSFFLYLLPSMIYFRLGVKSDYQSIPICLKIIPNNLFMLLIQCIGIICLFGNITGFIWVLVHRSINSN